MSPRPVKRSRIGVEITEQWFKAVELTAHDEVANFLLVPRTEEDGSSPSELGRRLRQLLDEHGFNLGPAAVVCEDADVVHSVTDLPSMSDAEADAYLTRELRRKVSADIPADAMVTSYRQIDAPTEQMQKQVFLGASVPRKTTEAWMELLAHAEVESGPLLTVPVSLVNCLGLLPVWWADTPLIIALVGQQTTHLLLYIGHSLKLVREARCGLPLPTKAESSGAVDLDAIAERLAKEIVASVQYVSRQEGELALKRVILAGDNDLRPLMKGLAHRLQPQVELFNCADQLNLADMGELGLRFREMQHQLAAPLGAAIECFRAATNIFGLAKKATPAFDFTPAEVVVARQRKSMIWIAGAATALAVFALLYLWSSTASAVGTRQRAVSILTSQLNMLNPKLQQIEGIEQQRARDRDARVLADTTLGSLTMSAYVLRELGRLMPNEVLLETLTQQRTDNRWQVIMQGHSRAQDPTAAQAAFNMFYRQILSSPMFTDIEFEPLHLTVQPDKAPKDKARPAVTVEPAQVAFQIRAHLAPAVEKQLETAPAPR